MVSKSIKTWSTKMTFEKSKIKNSFKTKELKIRKANFPKGLYADPMKGLNNK